MFIIFTFDKNMVHEKELLIHFIENELSFLHVRKPEMNEKELRLWLSQFEEKQLSTMVLHQHHQLASIFPVKGIHLKEKFRKNQKNLTEYIEQFQSNGFSVSTSFHDEENLKREASAFDYVFLSPVFTSVSKEGYKGKNFNAKQLPYKVIALGGIETDKICITKKLGYSGVGILGGVWLSKHKKNAFMKMMKSYKNVYD